jgi:hypothetical protein
MFAPGKCFFRSPTNVSQNTFGNLYSFMIFCISNENSPDTYPNINHIIENGYRYRLPILCRLPSCNSLSKCKGTSTIECCIIANFNNFKNLSSTTSFATVGGKRWTLGQPLEYAVDWWIYIEYY